MPPFSSQSIDAPVAIDRLDRHEEPGHDHCPIVQQSFDAVMKTSLSRRKQRRVLFDPMASVVLIPHRRSYSGEQKAKLYMSPKELKDIRKSCMKTVREINGGILCREEVCHRGLERYLTENERRVKLQREMAKEAVFGLQKVQQAKGVDTAELMGEMYGKNSEPSVAEALQAAVDDALDIDSHDE